MNIKKNTLLIILIAVITLFVLYTGNGIVKDGGMNGRMSEYYWMPSNSWRWFSPMANLLLGVLISWTLLRKKV